MNLLKILASAVGFTVMAVIIFTITLMCSDGSAKETGVEIYGVPPGIEITNVTTTWDSYDGRFKISGYFENTSEKSKPIHQINAVIYYLDGDKNDQLFTASGTDDFVKPGVKIPWDIATICVKRPSKVIIDTHPLWE